MVSLKERARLARLFDKQAQAMENQKKAIDRLVALNIGLSAALFEIAEGDIEPGSMRQRARRALEEAANMSAAVRAEAAKLGNVPEDGEPTPGEEKKNE